MSISPQDRTSINPCASRAVLAVMQMLPGPASCSMRFARAVVSPTASYSIDKSCPIERTTTAPELRPTRI
jgi:hypothetical protein